MKQLLDLNRQCIVGGWGDRVFAGHLDSSQAFELGPQRSTPPAVPEADKTKAQEIQAVGIYQLDTGDVWCAVARYDKTLCVYDMGRLLDHKIDNPHQVSLVQPCATYKTAKRVTSLCFATISAAEGTGKLLNVVIAADLAGDAVAFALDRNDDDHRQDHMTDQDEDISANRTSYRRLLLGHTASMLTCVRVATDASQGQHIFTADRDEKIRISAFPSTFIVEGFLLGHEAFVSCLDVAREGRKARCVSCSSDGSVRMWDYESNEELAKYMLSNKDETNSQSLPTKVAMNAQGDTILVCADEQDVVRILHWDDERRCFEAVVSDCRVGPALAINWIDDVSFLSLATEPYYLSAHRLEDGVVRQVDLPLVKVLNRLAADEKCALPSSILERDEFGVLKMQKQVERRVQNRDRAWNDAARIDVAKERDRRYKKRKKDREASSTDGKEELATTDE